MTMFRRLRAKLVHDEPADPVGVEPLVDNDDWLLSKCVEVFIEVSLLAAVSAMAFYVFANILSLQ